MFQNLPSYLARGIIVWYDFKRDSKILVLSEEASIASYLTGQNINTDCLSEQEIPSEAFINKHHNYYDYIIAVRMLEKSYDPLESVKWWKSVLKTDGHLLLAVENRLGIKYFCGEKDPVTGKLFQSIENYSRVPVNSPREMGARLYSCNEVEQFLSKSGFTKWKRYSVFPSLDYTQYIYSEKYNPNEDISVRVVPMYDVSSPIYIDEQHLYGDLVNNGLFHKMANCYFFDCSDSMLSGVLSATIQTDRKYDKQTVTLIKEDKTVEKKSLTEKSYKQLKILNQNLTYLKSRGIKVVETRLTENSIVMPYIESQNAVFYLRDLLSTDKQKFIEEMDRFRDLILQSSPHVENPKAVIPDYVESDGVILEKGFPDMTPINAFYDKGDFIFIDQEFSEENYPANAIIFKMVALVYDQDATRLLTLHEEFFFKRYGIFETLPKWIEMSNVFVSSFKAGGEISISIASHFRNREQIEENRKRLFDEL